MIGNTLNLRYGDCLELMKDIPSKSIDLILCDPPYGTTPLKWDSVLPFDELWKEYNRIIKDNGAIVLFATEPFATMLRASNIKKYRYDWYWVKERLTNVFQVKRRCGKVIENICVFYKKQPTYNPQKTVHRGKKVTNKIGLGGFSITQKGASEIVPIEYIDDGTRHPTQVLHFNRDNPRKRLHPTQKPVALLEYLINTYTNEGDTVLDNCMGSGSTGCACIKTNRKFIGIEKNKKYFETARVRMDKLKAELWGENDAEV